MRYGGGVSLRMGRGERKRSERGLRMEGGWNMNIVLRR